MKKANDQMANAGGQIQSRQNEKTLPDFAKLLRAYACDCSGSVSAEYGLIAGATSLAVILTIGDLADVIRTMYNALAGAFNTTAG